MDADFLARAEAMFMDAATDPDAWQAAPFDLVQPAQHHMFTVRPGFGAWIAYLQRLRRQPELTANLLMGHGTGDGSTAVEASLAYLRAAETAYSRAGDPDEYTSLLEERFPERGHSDFVHLAALFLYGRLPAP